MTCYLRFNRTNDLAGVDSKDKIRAWIKNKIKEWSKQGNKKTGIMAFSITEKDYKYMNWLEVFSEFKGVGCTSTKTKYHAGGYTCYYITIPVAENV